MSGVVRVFDNDKSYGDEYSWASTCRFLDLKTVEILGVTKPLLISERKAILALFANMNIENVVYNRYKNGKPYKKTYNTQRFIHNDANTKKNRN